MDGGHPLGRSASALTAASSGKAFDGSDGFFDLLPLRAKLRQHMHDIGLRHPLRTDRLSVKVVGAEILAVDLEAAVRDPNHPDTFLPTVDPGDHLHPNDAGYKAMGDAIDLKLFTLKPKQP